MGTREKSFRERSQSSSVMKYRRERVKWKGRLSVEAQNLAAIFLVCWRKSKKGLLCRRWLSWALTSVHCLEVTHQHLVPPRHSPQQWWDTGVLKANKSWFHLKDLCSLPLLCTSPLLLTCHLQGHSGSFWAEAKFTPPQAFHYSIPFVWLLATFLVSD